MDTLALLCNLHADGPATLQRLRHEACESLGTLLLWEAPELSECLDWEEHICERFLREAASLAERLDEPVVREEFEEEEDFEDGEDFVAGESDGDSAVEKGEWVEVGASDSSHFEDEADEDFEEEDMYAETEKPALGLDAGSSEAVKEVLGAWRKLDLIDPPPGPDESSLETPEKETQLRDYVVEPSRGTPNRPLARVELAGLDERMIRRLAGMGIHSLGGLVETATTPLSRRLGLPFTRLRRLQFLARKELDTGADLQGQEAPSEGRERASGSAGPFA
ncbi:MAG: hypothetical protein CMJ89_19015 [Planctomycetes bacterium]|jgi:hypothetical protein|nr:hypothetical protein [Planctomycetota bacterium]